MSLSRTERAILVQLDRGDAFGLDLVRAGAASRGSVHVVLRLMEVSGLVDRYMVWSEIASMLPRHRFTITAEGREALAANPVLPSARVEMSSWRRLLDWLRISVLRRGCPEAAKERTSE